VTTYRIGADRIEAIMSRTKRARIRMLIICSLLLVGAVAALFLYPKLFRENGRWVFPLLMVICVQPIVRGLWNWERWPEKERRAYENTCVEISDDTVRLKGWTADTLLNASDITRAEEWSWAPGLLLRTRNRYRYFRVPRELDGYDSLKRGLAEVGIATVSRRFLPNWEEFVFIAAYCGVFLCILLARSSQILTVNLVAAVAASGFGLHIVRSSPAPALRGFMGVVGVLVPTLFAAGALWVALHGW
jgi:hypothetical protein